MPEDWQKCLAIVAHPDDLEYGGASAVAKWTAQGKEVVYLMVSRGEAGIDSMHPSEVAPLRSREEIDAASVVGVDVVEFLDYPDGVIEYDLPLRRGLEPGHSATSSRRAGHPQLPPQVCLRPPEHGRPPQRGAWRYLTRRGDAGQSLDFSGTRGGWTGYLERGTICGGVGR